MKTVKVIFEKGEPVEVIIDSSEDFFGLFGEDVKNAWKKLRKNQNV